MKNYLFPVLISLFLVACSKNDVNNNNPFLPNYSFDTGNTINTSLPQFTDLQFSGNYIILGSPYGINGTVISRIGDSFSAFELTDPNHTLQPCSKLSVPNLSTIASCNCDDGNSYEIFNGLPQEGSNGQYPLKRYFVEVSGTIIRVYNN